VSNRNGVGAKVDIRAGSLRQKLESYVAKFRADALGELNQVRAEQEGTAATSVALKDRVERAVVRSPVNGTVKSVKVTTIGGVVQPGSELMEIVPLEDNLLVEARVKPRDIAFLRPGQEALVKIGLDFSIYGGFSAKPSTSVRIPSRTRRRARVTISCRCAPPAASRRGGRSRSRSFRG
jgi:hypothetical protein